jgi:hypothetical protein
VRIEEEPDIFEQDLGVIFPLAEIKTVLEKHGYTMENSIGFTRTETDAQTLSILITRKSGDVGISSFAWFSNPH